MSDGPVLTERVSDQWGGYVQAWHIEPPAPGVKFRVLRDEWDDKPGNLPEYGEIPVRHIYEIAVT